MFKSITSLCVSIGMVAGSALPASANNFVDRQSDVTAGFFLKIPLTGGIKLSAAQKPYEYGFRFQVRDNYHAISGVRSDTLGFDADAFALKFDPDGFSNIAVSGQNVIEYGPVRLNADGTEREQDSGVNWWLVGGGVAALVVVGGIATANSLEDTFEGIFEPDD